MRYSNSLAAVTLFVLGLPVAFAATSVEKIRNPKVLVTEVTLAPGESEAAPDVHPSMLVYMADGAAQITGSKEPKELVRKGQTVFQPAASGTLLNAGSAPLHFARIYFLTDGSPETWGKAGLAPAYLMLAENQYARAYDIRIPAHTFEPQHTHHDRVVVSLSGAELEHILPDGTHQSSTLKTGEIVWRLGATHVGHNLGTTDLWVIAVEPK
jgi:hypothetical protein